MRSSAGPRILMGEWQKYIRGLGKSREKNSCCMQAIEMIIVYEYNQVIIYPFE
jgi:hypothetical protein